MSGYKTPLRDQTIWDLQPSDQVKPLIKLFYQSWLKSSKSKKQYVTKVHEESSYSASYDEHGYDHHQNMESVSEQTPLLGKQRSQLSRSGKKSKEFKTWKVNSSAATALWKAFGLYFSLIGIYEVFNIILTFIRPLILE